MRRSLSIALVILLAGATVTGLVFTQHAYKSYEDLDQPRMNALSWISSYTQPNAIILTSAANASSAHFDQWVSGLANRRAIGEEFAFVPNLPDLTYSQEQLEAHLASMVLKGNLILENGMVMVADSFPYDAPYRPLIGAYVGDYLPMGFLDWRNTNVTVTGPGLAPSSHGVPLDSFGHSSNYSLSRSPGKDSVSYSYGGAQSASGLVTFNESLTYGQPGVNIHVSWSSSVRGDALSELNVGLGLFTSASELTTSASGASFSVESQFGTHLSGNLTLGGSGYKPSFTAIPVNSSLTYVDAALSFRPASSGSVTFKFAFDTVDNVIPLSFYDFRTIQQSLGFEYLLVFRSRLLVDQFVLSLGPVAYRNPEIEIVQVTGT